MESDGKAHCDFPASSSHVTACGGTQIKTSGSAITSETAWSDGGGGISDVFNLPSWQANAQVPPSVNSGGRIGRGIPDVCGNASPNSGYQILADGQQAVVGGTSAVAPLWAALTARLNQKLGKKVGFLNPTLYGLQPDPLVDITQGSNGSYDACPGWDACTGLGRPDGTKLLNAL